VIEGHGKTTPLMKEKMCTTASRMAVFVDPEPDLNPAFYLKADPDPDPGSQTNADPCGSRSWSDFKVTKV
jgi:hypothetical protein